MNDLPGRLTRMIASGEEDAAVLDDLRNLEPKDDEVDAVLRILQDLSPADPLAGPILAAIDEMQAGQAPRPAMNIEAYYRPGVEPYELRWPLASSTAAVMPFPWEALDHKTQFFVLFQEWTRREMEASLARNEGDLDGARAGFEECLARAEQLDVDELRARSYEDLATVAEKQDDLAAVRHWLEAAQAVRAAI
jgi:hypothetical protein